MDVTLITNEIIDELKQKNFRGVFCKLNMEKTYNHVNMGFLDYMIERMSFEDKWRKWVRCCISTTSFAIMVNRGSSSFLKANKDLKQGDLLSPLLFIIVMEALKQNDLKGQRA